MPKNKNKKVVYYTDPLNDDFAGTNIKTKVVDEKFRYIHKNPVWRCCSFVLYYVVALPLVWLYCKIFLHIKIVNKKSVKKIKKQSYFMYGNHTGFYDAFIPNLISAPRFNRIIVGADTVSIFGLKNIVQMLGAVPLPTSFSVFLSSKMSFTLFHRSSRDFFVCVVVKTLLMRQFSAIGMFVTS